MLAELNNQPRHVSTVDVKQAGYGYTHKGVGRGGRSPCLRAIIPVIGRKGMIKVISKRFFHF
jgi:hypothetical protein